MYCDAIVMMDQRSHDTEPTYQITLGSDVQYLRKLDPFLRSIPGCSLLPPDAYHNVLLILTEAVSNAMAHGNQYHPERYVTVQATVADHEIHMMVTDCGKGFDPDALPDPLHPDRLLQEGGRGVFLMRHMADEVSFHLTPEGLTVHLIVRW